MIKMNEKYVEDRLVELLERKGIFSIKGNPYNMKGFPDRLVFADKIYFVEIKLGKEMGSYYGQIPLQKWWQRKIEASNGNYVLLKGLREIEEFVKTLPTIKPD